MLVTFGWFDDRFDWCCEFDWTPILISFSELKLNDEDDDDDDMEVGGDALMLVLLSINTF